MIREIAHLTIKPGTQEAFEAAVKKAQPLFERATGCRRVELHHVIEKPEAYILLVTWNTLDDHLKGFRESEDFKTWRSLVGGFFASAPDVVHSNTALAFDAP